MHIEFKTLRYQNILSTGNQFTEIMLNRSPSTLIIGENGAGKSTMLDALHFALYGKPFRSINKPQLINSITRKNLLVELEFRINKKDYMVRRGIKPNVFQIFQNDELIDQDASVYDYQDVLEKQLVRMSSKTFKQIVVLGSANYVPFMQLSSPNRRGVIDDLLDIDVFSVMSLLLREKVSNNKSELTKVNHEMDVFQAKIDSLNKHIAQRAQDMDSQVQAKEARIDEYTDRIEALEQQANDLSSKSSELLKQVMGSDLSAKKQKYYGFLQQSVAGIDSANETISFYEDNNNCPTCDQEIDEDFKKQAVQSKQDRLKKLTEAKEMAAAKLKEVEQAIEKDNQLRKEMNSLDSQVTAINREIATLNQAIKQIVSDIEELSKSTDDYESNAAELKSLVRKKNSLERRKKSLVERGGIHDVAQAILKDTGIKTKIIRTYVPIINKLINKYLAALDFFVSFELDEAFNETVKSRHRDKFSYASFSEGEKLRLDLALMFTWRDVAKVRNSTTTNLLIMDEVFDSSLDSTGTDEFLKILETLSGGTNVFVISHKGDQLFDKFFSVIRFEKNHNFSQIAKTP